ncbi:MAG: glycosyltransferase family 4 protein [Omnitrophica WOR_2 bacterium]
MNILIALTYYRPHYSGLTIHVEREASALVARGHHVTVLTSRFDRRLPKREVINGVEVIRLDVLMHISKGVIMPGMVPMAWRLARWADVVHLHLPQLDAAPIALIFRILGKPVVVTYHCDLQLPSGLVNRIANQVSDIANHISARIAGAVVHNTRDYAEYSPFMRRYLSKVRPILPPVELTPVTPADRQAFREKYHLLPGQRIIGMAARLATEKGVEYLAEALPIVLKKYPTARVLFVGPYQKVFGEEQYAEFLAPLIQSLEEHWTFLGILSPVEMTAFFHECEVTVLPSINSTESYGLVQVESMACGTPVVASDMPGVRVPVRMSGMGLTVPPKNPQALADALIEILDHREQYNRDPPKIVQISTPEHVAAEYEAVFESVMASGVQIETQPGKEVNK